MNVMNYLVKIPLATGSGHLILRVEHALVLHHPDLPSVEAFHTAALQLQRDKKVKITIEDNGTIVTIPTVLLMATEQKELANE